MNPAIGREFHFASLLKFAFPSIIMMIFMSLYTIVDGIFISRFVGTAALSATNIVYPVINVTYAFSIMLATGGSAIVARKLGEGKPEEARRDFSLITLATVLIGVLIALAGCLFIDPLCRMLGADQALIGYCRDYLRILLLFAAGLDAPASVPDLLCHCRTAGFGAWTDHRSRTFERHTRLCADCSVRLRNRRRSACHSRRLPHSRHHWAFLLLPAKSDAAFRPSKVQLGRACGKLFQRLV